MNAEVNYNDSSRESSRALSARDRLFSVVVVVVVSCSLTIIVLPHFLH